ncbi:hypothetical protein ACS0TY_005087 [Phlomoides rotata]
MASGPSSTDPLLSPPLVDPTPSDSIQKPSYASVANKSIPSSSNRFFDEKIVTPVCTVEECGNTPVLVFSSTATKSLAKDLKLALVGKFSHALPSGKQIEDVLIEQKVYDYVPPFCVLCSHVGYDKVDCYVYVNKPRPPRRFDAKNGKGKTPMHSDDGVTATESSKQPEVAKHDGNVERNGKGKGLTHGDMHKDTPDDVTVPMPRSESVPRGWVSDGVSGYNPFGPLAMTVYDENREEGEIIESDHSIPEDGGLEDSKSSVLGSEELDDEGSTDSDTEYSDGSTSEDDILTNIHTLIHAESSSESGQVPVSGQTPASVCASPTIDGLQESSIHTQLHADVSGKLNTAVSKTQSILETSSKQKTGRRDIELIPIAGLT